MEYFLTWIIIVYETGRVLQMHKEVYTMKRHLQKLSAVLCAVLVLSMMFGMTVMADGTDTSTFDFGQTNMSIRQGESQTISFYAKAAYTYYVRGNSSKATYCECSGNAGSSNITFHVGSDETAGKTVNFWFYIEGSDAHDLVQVRVVQSASSAGTAGTTMPTIASAIPQVAQMSVAFPGGNTGIVSVTGNLIGMLMDSQGLPLAAFSIANKSGKILTMQLQNMVSVNGISYIGVYSQVAPANITISISAADKAAMMARGIAGLYIGQQYILWP